MKSEHKFWQKEERTMIILEGWEASYHPPMTMTKTHATTKTNTIQPKI